MKVNDVSRWPREDELAVARVGPCERPSPLPPDRGAFVDDRDRVLVCRTSLELAPFLEARRDPPDLERAGARRSIHFDPKVLTCGILTCGGLCPGLNNVVRSLVLS
jgi:6-phosphofructokinase 1